jgi:hypothetical protein
VQSVKQYALCGEKVSLHVTSQAREITFFSNVLSSSCILVSAKQNIPSLPARWGEWHLADIWLDVPESAPSKPESPFSKGLATLPPEQLPQTPLPGVAGVHP